MAEQRLPDAVPWLLFQDEIKFVIKRLINRRQN